MSIKTIVVCVLLAAVSHCYTEDWRGIVPLHSTCEDVKRILGIAKCESSLYQLEDETINITFSEKPCADGWNVPPGTVISFTVSPKKKPRLTDLHIDIGAYKKAVIQDQPDKSYYYNEEEGVSIAVTPDGRVDYITYSPTPKDNYLRYPNSLADHPEADGDPHSSIKFDEYGNISFNNEKARLNDFALQLQAQPDTQAYIIAYGGRRSCVQEAQVRAERAKNYLVNTRGIEASRIVTVDGGYREEVTVELFIKLSGGSAPVTLPTVCPSEVQISDCSKVKKSSRPRQPRSKQPMPSSSAISTTAMMRSWMPWALTWSWKTPM